jgi:acyl-CoA thioesterase
MPETPLKIAPFGKHLGIEPLEVGEGIARIRLPFRKELTNPAGKLHGGVIATVADSAMAMAVGSVLGEPARHSTVKLEIKYKAPVTSGEIIAEATIQRRKQSVFLGEAVIKDGNGQIVAIAKATFMVMNHTPEDA